MPALFCMYNFGTQPSGSDLPEIAAAQDETSLHLFEVLCSIRDSAVWPVLGNSVPKLGHEFLLLWLYFHSFLKILAPKAQKNCGL